MSGKSPPNQKTVKKEITFMVSFIGHSFNRQLSNIHSTNISIAASKALKIKLFLFLM